MIALALMVTTFAVSAGDAPEARITVHPDQIANRITRHMTGLCMEDINHEVYGGIYSQMVFGESFQEPPPESNVRGFTGYTEGWNARNGELHVTPGVTKLVADGVVLADGEMSVEMRVPEPARGNLGVLVRVTEPGVGEDNLNGYYITVDTLRDELQINRHRKDFKTLATAAYRAPVGQWIKMGISLEGKKIGVSIDGEKKLEFQDAEDGPASGSIGFKTFRREAFFRNLIVAGKPIDFEAAKSDFDEVSKLWDPIREGSVEGSLTLEREAPRFGRHSQRLAFKSGDGAIGIANRSLNRWGMKFVNGKTYECSLWLRSAAPAEIDACLESEDGSRSYGKKSVEVPAGEWRRHDFTLTPNGDDVNGRFALKLRSPGTVDVGYAFLQPGEWGRFKGLPVRKDIAELMLENGVTVMRYGGSMVNNPTYRWKKMIGPRQDRPPYVGSFYPYSTNGFGILDFLSYCEAAGFFGVPAFCMDEGPQDMADFMEYVNGAGSSEWGARRVKDGHAKPYGIRVIQLGNEESVDENYFAKFKPMAEAIWKKDPKVVLVVGDFSPDLSYKQPLTGYKNVLELAREHNREIWFDVHVFTDTPNSCHEQTRLIPMFIKELRALVPGAQFKVGVFEFNAYSRNLGRALGNAHAINELERMGDDVVVACSANALQPWRQNDDGWDQGLLFFTPTEVWAQPQFYVTQMISQNYLPRRAASSVASPGDELDVTATVSDDGRVLALHVMNPGDAAVPCSLDLSGFAPSRPEASVVELTGQLADTNEPPDLKKVAPTRRKWKHGLIGGKGTYTFPARSFTVIRFE